MTFITCVVCSNKVRRALSSSVFCLPCLSVHSADGWRAILAVRKAIRRGDIAHFRGMLCVDCNAPATEYEHRDYMKPLAVDPICRSCNHKRGHAFNSVYRPELAEAA